MIGGNETCDFLEEDPSQDLACGFSTKSDTSNVSPSQSQYSSCGESDIERYCSANSAMGAPSLGSSIGTFHECLDSELGSMKNFGPGKVSGLEDLSLGGRVVKSQVDFRLSSLDRFDCLGHHNTEGNIDLSSDAAPIGYFANEDNSGFMLPMVESKSKISRVGYLNTDFEELVYRENVNENFVPWEGHDNSEASQSATQISFNEKDMGGKIDESVLLELELGSDFLFQSGFEEKTFEGIFVEQVKSRFDESNSTSISQHGEHKEGRLSSDDGLSSIYEHSEDEDSMYDYVAVGEHKYNLCYDDKIQHDLDVGDINEIPFSMNSAIAFGSKDWDDFEFQTEDSGLATTIINNFREQKQVNLETEMTPEKSTYVIFSGLAKREDAIVIHPSTNQAPNVDESDKYFESSVNDISDSTISKQGNVVKKPRMTGELSCTDDYTEYLESCDVSNIFETMQDPLQQKEPENVKMRIIGICKPKLDTLTFDRQAEFENYLKSPDFFEKSMATLPKSNLFYDEIVDDMEEILLEVNNSPEDIIGSQTHAFVPLRDGGSSASTSSKDDATFQYKSHRIDGIELVGAKQRKGDVSLGERLVGVKEYTVYIIRAWSGNNQWEVEHRYRDFLTLYHRLKSFYDDQGWILPSPWSSVELESRKIFGSSSPNVVAQRSNLIQDCLHSILHSRALSSLPSAFILFLFPQGDTPCNSPASNSTTSFTLFNKASDSEAVSYGNMISFIVEIHTHKSIRQLLEVQHYGCAGCHLNFDGENLRLFEFVQTFEWGKRKPRVCKYTGHLFCSTCHTNDTAVLPARVLHHWDFTHYPVSQLAKSYLDSIHDQPMLCVSAVNPLLFSKVPSLLHIMSVREKIAAMLPIVRCPFRRSIYIGLGSRKYLLENNDFFALRDLIDLSKGPFAAVPVMIENVSTKILQHITEHCLICCDVGVPCGARRACDDPSSLIFSFQKEEVEKCQSCDLVFHKPCFKNLKNCICGAILNASAAATQISDFYSAKETHDSKSAVGFLSGLFSKAKNKNECWKKRNEDNVILMGHLPTTSL